MKVLVFALLATCSFGLGACNGDNGGAIANMCLEACSEAADCVTTGTTEDDWNCQRSRCVYNMCSNDDDCTSGAFTRCNSFGMCGCVDDSECTGSLTKYTSFGICGCVDDSECTQSTRDKCYDGFCGCSSVDVCTGNTQGANTAWVCEKS